MNAPGHIGAHILAPALDAVQHGEVRLVGVGIHSAELSVEIGSVLFHGLAHIVDLIIHDHLLSVAVFQRNAETLAERHRPVAVKGVAGIDTHRQGHQRRIFVQAAAEEIAKRALHGGRFLAVPINAENLSTPHAGRGQPDLTNFAFVMNVRQRQRLARRDEHPRVDLPASAQFAGRFVRAALFHRHSAALALFARQVFRGNRDRLIPMQPTHVIQHHFKPFLSYLAFILIL